MSTPYIPGPLVEEDDPNPVVLPKGAKAALQNHVYDPNINPATGKRFGYQRRPYEHQEYPKQLYHPDYGKRPKPDVNDFARAAKSVEETEKAMTAFQQALAKWNRSNRIKTVTSKKEEDRLLKIGWMPTPPQPETAQAFDPNSDEL